MTTGTYVSGATPIDGSNHFHSYKAWDGANGRTVSGRAPAKGKTTVKMKWNSYSMRHKSAYSSKVATTMTNPFIGTFTDDESFANVYPNSTAFPTNPFGTAWTTADEYKLLAKLLTKVKGSSYNIGVSLAEVDKLASSVVTTVQTLGFGVADLALGNFRSFARRFGTHPPSYAKERTLRSRDLSGRFLEMRYAWEPTIADTYDAAKAFEALSNGPRSKVFKASRRKMTDYWVDLTYGRIRQSRTVRRIYTYEAYEELAAWRQMGLGNPASILWERIPYSFVLDWFIPIGTYLELIGQVPFLKGRFMRSDIAELVASGRTQTRPNVVFPPNTNTVTDGGDIVARLFWYDRTLLDSLSVPYPSVNVAGAIHGKRIGNAIALAHQLFDRAFTLLSKKSKLAQGLSTAIESISESVQ